MTTLIFHMLFLIITISCLSEPKNDDGSRTLTQSNGATANQMTGTSPIGATNDNQPGRKMIKFNDGHSVEGAHSDKGWVGHLPIYYQFDISIPNALQFELEQAMLTWEDALCLSGRMFIPSYQASDQAISQSAKINSTTVMYDTLNDRTVGFYFVDNWGTSTNKDPSTLATTVWENDPQDIESIVKGDILFNTQEYHYINTKDPEYPSGYETENIVDLRSIALHEIGHLLGLGHVDDQIDVDSVMNERQAIGINTSKRVLSIGDITRMRQIYQETCR